MQTRRSRRRLVQLMAAGLVDSLCLSVAWTIVVLQVAATYGLGAAGLCSAAMLAGVALSAPAAGWLARRVDGRRFLRIAATVEAALRLSVFLLLFAEAPVWGLALCVCAMNVTAWTGYAGMRAEVAAVSDGPSALTWYGTIVAAVEAVGIAVAALLAVNTATTPNTMLLAVMAAYVLALVPTALVAGSSPVRRAAPRRVGPTTRRRPTVAGPALIGTLLMFAASAPTLLAVALAAQLHGRSSVALAAVAFTLGSLAAPALAGRIQARRANHPTMWVLCGLGMIAGWTVAPLHIALLCLAQVMSGLFMTTLEGLLDATVARRHPDQVTGALARATAGRALGSAAGTALLPLVVAAVGVRDGVALITTALLLAGVLAQITRIARPGTRRHPAPTEVDDSGVASLADLPRSHPSVGSPVVAHVPQQSAS